MSDASADPLTTLQRILFLLTLAVELLALLGAVRSRTGFERGDAGWTIWTLIAAFLGLRWLAELRLATLYFDLIPHAITNSRAARELYVEVLRYLYSVSDVILVAALVLAIRSYRGLGLQFRLQTGDRAIMVGVASLPLVAMALREQLTGFLGAEEQSILIYRLVAVTLSSLTAMLCIVILRYVRQMGGGTLSKVWGAVVLAGLARAGSFVVLALLAAWSLPWANVVEQVLLLAFATAWLAAVRYQRRVQAFAEAAR